MAHERNGAEEAIKSKKQAHGKSHIDWNIVERLNMTLLEKQKQKCFRGYLASFKSNVLSSLNVFIYQITLL